MKIEKWKATWLGLTFLWIFIRGVTPGSIVQELIIGAGIGFIVTYSLRNLFPGKIDLTHWLTVSPVLLRYAGNFTKELVTANIDVAKRLIHPGAEINPDVVEVNLRLRNPAAITVLANSITLTPGTLTMDYNQDRNSLYVHGITAATDNQKILEPILHWEDMLLKIFREEKGVEI